MSARATGYLFLNLAMVTVGSTIVTSKIIAAGMPPFAATALRFALAFPISALLMYLTRTPWPRPDRRDQLLLVLQASAGGVGYTVLLISGLSLAPAVNGAVVAGTPPAVAALFAILVLRERPRWTTLAAIALATLGVAMITVRGDNGLSFSRETVLGNALLLAAVVCESVFILLNKRLRVPLPPLPQSTLMCGIGLVVATAPALLEPLAGQRLERCPHRGCLLRASSDHRRLPRVVRGRGPRQRQRGIPLHRRRPGLGRRDGGVCFGRTGRRSSARRDRLCPVGRGLDLPG